MKNKVAIITLCLVMGSAYATDNRSLLGKAHDWACWNLSLTKHLAVLQKDTVIERALASQRTLSQEELEYAVQVVLDHKNSDWKTTKRIGTCKYRLDCRLVEACLKCEQIVNHPAIQTQK